MSDKIYFRRGNKANLPALSAGEPGFALDTKEFFIGSASGNIEFASVLSGGYKFQNGTATITSGTSVVVTFPIAFSSAPIAFVTSTSSAWTFIVQVSSSTQMTIYTYSGMTVSASTSIFWVAIGS
jgi:hypothetical protein